jgi:DASS family divalent anion:Na+ symporter
MVASDTKPPTLTPARLVSLVITIVVGIVIWFLAPPLGVKQDAWHLLAIFVATIVGIISKPLPMGAVAIIGVAATALTGILSIGDALSGFSVPTIWLIGVGPVWWQMIGLM